MKKSNIPYFIIIILVILLYLKRCGDTPVEYITETKIERVTDTIYGETPVYKPEIITNTVVLPPDTVLLTIHDTIAIIQDFFTKRFYSDSIQMDSITLVINDTVYNNEIYSRLVEYEILYPTITITNTEVVNKNEFYIGIGMGGNKNDFNYLGPEFALRNKKGQIYSLGVGLIGENSPNIHARVLWKIQFGKN